jgi:hypothetical protein
MRALGDLRRKPPLEAPKQQEEAQAAPAEVTSAPAAQESPSFDESVVIE